MRQALEELIVDGVKTTVEFNYVLLHHPDFILGHYDTSFIEGFIGELKENAKLVQ